MAIVDMTVDLFSSVGMKIKHSKLHCINIKEGELTLKRLTLFDAVVIPPVNNNVCICSLEQTFDM